MPLQFLEKNRLGIEIVFSSGDEMKRRPVMVMVIAGLLIATGLLGFGMHVRDLVSQQSFHPGELGVPILSLVGAITGIFLLLGRSWARWLAVTWMVFHVVISFFDSWQKVAVHVVLLFLFAYALFRRDASAYFS